MATVAELLHEGVERLRASGSESPRLDAELLLGHAIGADRTAIVAHPEAPVGPGAEATFRAGLSRRERGEPVAYIRGFKEFYGLAMATDRRALIPRPETERLVELAEAEVVDRLTAAPRPPGSPPFRIADVGTGGGTIAVSLAVALRRRRVSDDVDIVATESDPDALDLARENAVGHGVADRITFTEVDLLPAGELARFDLVLANLPYVRSAAVDELPVAASFEPRAALDGGADGLSLVERLMARLPEALLADGEALVEIGADQGEAIVELAGRVLPGWRCAVEADLSGQPRVARLSRP